jgi:RNA polymerase sigma-70 factor (ECF subfamily)
MFPELLPRLWEHALRLSRDPRDAEELVQQACARALETAHELMADTSPLNWMLSLVHSMWISDPRARDTRGAIAMKPCERAAAADPAAMLERVVTAVDELPDGERAVVLLVDAEKRDHHEAAKILDVPVATVRSRLWHARQSVERRCSGREHEDAPAG